MQSERRIRRTIAFLLSLAFSANTATFADDRSPASTNSDNEVIIPREVIQLFNGRDLSLFYTWLANFHREDPYRVFSVVDSVDGTPAIRISGEHWGALTTKQRFANYRLVAEFRWGVATWGKRANMAKDSGVLLHCSGRDGNLYDKDFNGPWKRCYEFQIIQGGVGDLLVLGGYEPDGSILKYSATATVMPGRYGQWCWDAKGTPKVFELEFVNWGRINWWGRDPDWKDKLGFRGRQDVESPGGEWTHIEAVCAGDTLDYFVNGKRVNQATHLSQQSGQLIFQSEGAEIFFRRIELHPLPATIRPAEEKANPSLASEINSKIDPRDAPRRLHGWQKHNVVRLNGSAKSLAIPAEFYLIGGEWDYSNSQMPYLVYMPDRKTLMMAAEVGPPSVKTILTFSEDFGKTWTKPKWMHTDAVGKADLMASTELTYLGNGKLISSSGPDFWSSADYGQTWAKYGTAPLGAEGKPMYQWDPMLADKDPKTGKVIRLVETRYKENGKFDTTEYFSQGCIRSSSDEGRTWSKELDVPQWKGVNETVLCRAKNGDIVAASRTDNPKQFLGQGNDQYSGLATSVSKDNGATWTELNPLYFWGRHHPHMILLPSGEIVLTYAVRNGYTDDRNGFPRFGIEAVISNDNGKTWDLDHKYILASYTAQIKGTWWGSTQSTSSVLLPDGSLLTAFGTGVRNLPTQNICKMDVALVKWRPSHKRVNSEQTLRDAPYQSDLRNKFDPKQ